jgi:hypothetical protein
VRFRRQIIDDLSFFPFENLIFQLKNSKKDFSCFLFIEVFWFETVRLKVKIVEPHFLSKRVISGLFLKAKTEEEEFAELNVQELGV